MSAGRMQYGLRAIFLLFYPLLFLHPQCQAGMSLPPAGAPSHTSSSVTQLLDSLIEHPRYDPRLRPHYGGAPVEVGISLQIFSISAVNEMDMDFTLDLYIRQAWNDSRLAFDPSLLVHNENNSDGEANTTQRLTLGIEYLDRLWKPDIFFPNAKRANFHTVTIHNSYLRIYADGRVRLSQRLAVTADCPMQLELFPADTQVCTLQVESYGYAYNEVSLQWGVDRPDGKAVFFDKVTLPQYSMTGYRTTKANRTNSPTGKYLRLCLDLQFTRRLGYYLVNIGVPSALLVSVSWVSFWLAADDSSTRVGLGVSIILTLIVLISAANGAMPKVSYVRAVDVYLNACLVMAYASLLESVVVIYTRVETGKAGEKVKPDKASANGSCNGGGEQVQNGNTGEEKVQCEPPTTQPLSCRLDTASRVFFPSLFAVFIAFLWLFLSSTPQNDTNDDWVVPN